ncbi:Peptidase A24A, prepilin type IV [Halanaeroarchaeum sp. HSR-CO]|uniref:DUF5817 domain-containing protein n=1 Tax=Halanaeroarchaeum sp. HSR-CO TaxID=2866382 RepID=UPI00217EABA2|nr:DUF5817 domain-containing protein [Halanaeroarchaeum sp. HSR-CO]UWG48812.1 Peptidase A24A, prepilin type IV [Halanaeroarchaeum sp. HSR-CO]
MYAVVGCSDCEALWIVEGRPETTGCPRCGSRHRFEALKKFVTTDDEDHARDVRSALLAKRRGEEDAFARVDSFAELEPALEDVGTTDEEYLAASGIDTEEVAAAGERAMAGNQSRSRKDVVLDALAALDHPDEAAVVEFAGERGVPADYVRSALEKLERMGRVSRGRDGYRLL